MECKNCSYPLQEEFIYCPKCGREFADSVNVFKIKTEKEFRDSALKIFRLQAENVLVYRQFLEKLSINPKQIKTLEEIPFLPISFFKTHKILNQNQKEKIIFTSSGTTGTSTSKHFVSDITLYEQSFLKAFAEFYGNIEDFALFALLPSYLERQGSSLIYMVKKLIAETKNSESGFFLDNIDELVNKLRFRESKNKKTLLIGVSFALLDLTEKHKLNLKNTIVMETGGMKGRRKEMTRSELHSELTAGLGVKKIHSEYGMTELLSQAYSKGAGVFETPPWMKIMIRDTFDPFSYVSTGKTGGINVIDLANINACSFIETEDLGIKHPNGRFEVSGRFDKSTVRGCNLLYTT